MAVAIRQIHPDFAGEVSGVDLRQKLTPDDVKAIEAGMDRYAASTSASFAICGAPPSPATVRPSNRCGRREPSPAA
jgi:hypothetical protein